MSKRSVSLESLACGHPNAAGLASRIGAREIWACVPADRTPERVRRFSTFTPDLHALADWRVACGVDTVAMESTGVYWIPVFEVLEARGLLEFYDFYTAQVAACDAEIERHATRAALKPRGEGPEQPPEVPPLKPDSHRKNQSTGNARAEILRITGVDWVAVHGISASLAQTTLRVSEIGTDMRKWPTEKHFGSWLGLAPHNDISGGKVLRRRTLKTDNRAGQAFRQAAASVIRSQCAFGAYYRRKKAHFGPMPAWVATAHKNLS